MGTYVERFVYDAVDNLLQMQHRGSDPAHRGWTRAYDYLEPSPIEDDAASAPARTGNRLTRTTLDPNGASPPQVEPYQYDPHGNVTRMPHLGGGQPGPNMHLDYKDQLRRVDLGGGGTAHYVYDAEGRRVRKVWQKAPGLVEERIYLGGFEIFRRHDGPIGPDSLRLERETLHVMDDQQRVALVETRTVDTDTGDQAPRRLIRYQFGNRLGSAGLELDELAQIISYEEYAPYGSSTYQAVRSQTETAKRYRYTGKERDEESGFYYHGARYYACWLGRWTACDPKGLVDGTNLYAYVGGNPVGKLDPTGTQGQGGPNIDDALNGAIERLDEPGNPFLVHGKKGLQERPFTMDIDESSAVGERGISPAEARRRATSVDDRQFLDSTTNQRTKYLGTDTHPAPAARPPVSVADNPDALLTRRFGEITEMRDIFNEALGKIRNPNKMSPVALKNAINAHIRDIIKNGDSQSAVRVREALAKLGFENVPRKGYVMMRAPQPPPASPPPAPQAPAANPATTTATAETTTAASTVKNEAKAVATSEVRATTTAAGSEAGLLARAAGGAGGLLLMGLRVATVYFAYDAYKEGTRPNTPAPVGNGMIGGSTGEGLMNAAGALAGAPEYGTLMRQSAELGTAVHDPKKLWTAVKSGASPTSIGMGIIFGAFR